MGEGQTVMTGMMIKKIDKDLRACLKLNLLSERAVERKLQCIKNQKSRNPTCMKGMSFVRPDTVYNLGGHANQAD